MARTLPRAIGAVAAVVIVPTVVTRLRGGTDMNGALLMASVVAGSGVGYCIDDHAARTFASSPTSLLVRRSARAALCFAALGAAWFATFLVASTVTGPAPAVATLMPYLFGAAAIALAVATRVEPDAPLSPGLIAVFATLLSMACVDALSLRIAALPSLDSRTHRAAWWWIALAAAAAALYASRDPAARGLRRRRR